MSVDRKTGKINFDLGGPVEVELNFRKVAELERATGKGVYAYTTELYTSPLAVAECAKLFSLIVASPKLGEAEWGERIWANRRTFDWVSFVLDFGTLVFDVDTRAEMEPVEDGDKKNAEDQTDSTGSTSSEPQPTSE